MSAANQPQEIYTPVVARVRAFTIERPKRKLKGSLWYEGVVRRVEALSNPKLLAILARRDEDDEKERAIERSVARRVLQGRYIAEMKAAIPEWGAWGSPSITPDTETQDVDVGQAMRFGVAQCRGMQYRELIEFMQREARAPTRSELDALRIVYVFYDPAHLEADAANMESALAVLHRICAEKEAATGCPHKLITRGEFVKDALFKHGRIKHDVPLPVMVIGHNLGFDLGRLPDYAPTKARGKDALGMFGGFSLIMGTAEDPDARSWLPRIVMRKVGIGKRRYKSYDPNRRGLQLHIFVDTLMLTKALLGVDTPGSMEALCRMWGAPVPKEDVRHFEPLTYEYATYAYNDVDRTWFIYEQLRTLYSAHGLDKPIDRMFSVASVGKAYYAKMGIKPFLAKVKNDRSRTYKEQMYQLSGVAMEAMFGARAECGWTKDIRECINADFKSQYPTINICLGLQELLLAEQIDIVEDELDKSGDWKYGGADARLLSDITINDHLLSSNKGAVHQAWRGLRGYALVDPVDGIWPVRTVHQDDDNEAEESAAINVGVSEVESGPYTWVSYLDVLASKFLTGKMPRLLKTKRLVPVGKQKDLTSISFFGDDKYKIDLTIEGNDFFRMVIEMRASIKVDRDRHRKGSAEYVRLDAMQNALKLIANSTSYGVAVQVDVDEREEAANMTAYYGEQSYDFTARARERRDDGRKEASGVKAEKPGTWFAPWGPLITAGGRLLIAIAECLAREEGKEYGGIHYGMCDTDSMAFVRPNGMARSDFRAAVSRVTKMFQRLNPYQPTKQSDGKLTEDDVFAVEDINYEFTNVDGEFKVVKPKVMKPLYILSISAKRYAMANLVKADGSDYDNLSDLYTDRSNVVVILRKVSSHGLGHISAPSYKPNDERQHLAVPYKKDAEGEITYVISEVCKGKGNPRLFVDLWKLAFEQFILHHSVKDSREISHTILATIRQWPGLDEPQFKQRSLNTWNAWTQYAHLPNKRAEMFFNVIPAPIPTRIESADWVNEVYKGQALYCRGGSNVNVREHLDAGQVWWQKYNMPAVEQVGGDKQFELQEVRDAIGDYFDRAEFKAKGECGRLQRHRLVVFTKEYVGKETNFLLDEDLAEDDESQIEDAAARPYLRTQISPVLAALMLDMTHAQLKVGVTRRELETALKGVHTGGAPKVLRYFRNGFRFDEMARVLQFDANEKLNLSEADRRCNRLVALIRRAYDKTVKDAPGCASNEHRVQFCLNIGALTRNSKRSEALELCDILLTRNGVSDTISNHGANIYPYLTEDDGFVHGLTEGIEKYLGIAQAQDKAQKFVSAEKKRRKDAAYAGLRSERRIARLEEDRAENERVVYETLAEMYGNEDWKEKRIRVAEIIPGEVAAIFNRALRTPKRQRALLAATFRKYMEHWADYGYDARRRARNGSRQKINDGSNSAVYDPLREGRRV
jgi:hypothetical protein